MRLLLTTLLAAALAITAAASPKDQTMSDSLYTIQIKNAKGEAVSMNDYKGKTLLIVNTASECGFTKQYEGLETLYEKHKEKGLVVLRFPCNQFGGQEPGTDDEIQNFCRSKFGIKFPVMSKIEVNGANTHPLYVYLKKHAPGILGTEAIKWNFTKFLISKEGKVLKRFAPQDEPSKISSEIEAVL